VPEPIRQPLETRYVVFFDFINISIFYSKIDSLSNYDSLVAAFRSALTLLIGKAKAPKHSAGLSLVFRGVGPSLPIFSALYDHCRWAPAT
jgi:hypothetical protein